jgi:hypothetical protein
MVRQALLVYKVFQVQWDSRAPQVTLVVMVIPVVLDLQAVEVLTDWMVLMLLWDMSAAQEWMGTLVVTEPLVPLDLRVFQEQQYIAVPQEQLVSEVQLAQLAQQVHRGFLADTQVVSVIAAAVVPLAMLAVRAKARSLGDQLLQ